MHDMLGEPLRVDVSSGDGIVTIRCDGDIDLLSKGQLEMEFVVALSSGAKSILVVCDGVRFIDSSGIHALIHAAERALDLGIEFRVVPSAPVMRVASLLGVDGRLGMRKTKDETKS